MNLHAAASMQAQAAASSSGRHTSELHGGRIFKPLLVAAK
jgi:hypothetical protein